MFNFRETAETAADQFGLSMKDDPTLWPAGDKITAEAVRAACNQVAVENARSALSRGLGKIAEVVATEMDVAIHEDGPLADLDAVLAQYVEDAPEIDLSGVLEAEDWQDKVEALRGAFGVAVQSYSAPPREVIDIMAYVGSDPRLDGEIMRTVATLTGPEHSTTGLPASLALDSTDWDDAEPGAAEAAPAARERGKAAPGRKRRTKAEIAEDEAADAADNPAPAEHVIEWNDEAESAVESNEWDDEPLVGSGEPKMAALVAVAGIQDIDMAAIMGLSRSYYSLIRNGKRPWPGLKPDQVEKIAVELQARREAIQAIADALIGGDVLRPEGI